MVAPPNKSPSHGSGAEPGSRRVRAEKGAGAQLRPALITAADEILAETGSAGAITVRNVAKAAGVSVAALYLHFSSIEELRYEVAFLAFTRYFDDVQARLAQLPDPVDRIEGRGRAYLEFAFAQPELYRMLFMSRGTDVPDRFEGLELMTQTELGGMVTDVDAAMAAGTISDGDPRVVSSLLWMGVHGVASLMIALDRFPWPPVEYITDTMLAFLREAHTTNPALRPIRGC